MESRFAAVDYYDILGVTPTALEVEIKAAFRRQALQHHPDKATYNKELAKVRFQDIAEAYEVLCDDALRRHYDEVRTGPGRGSGRGYAAAPEGGSKPTSLAAERRARVAEELARATRERGKVCDEFHAGQRKEQEQYDSMKSFIKGQGGALPAGSAEWSTWMGKQVGMKWMHEAWEQHLPGHALSGSLQEAVLRDVQRDAEREAAARRAAREREQRAADAQGAFVSVRSLEAACAGPVPKRLAQRSYATASELSPATATATETRGKCALPPKALECLEKGRSESSAKQRKLEYIELLMALQDLGISTNEAEQAARRETSLLEALEVIASKG